MINQGVPVLGVIAWSGTGKTTLLTKVIPVLKSDGLRIALIKHAHHHFDIDHPGKDSYKLREAGAEQIVIASKNRMATIREMPENEEDPTLDEILTSVHLNQLDLVLVEGFKMADMPKIEIHRQCLQKPYLYPRDKKIIALVQDGSNNCAPEPIVNLDLDNPEEVADFIIQYIKQSRVQYITENG